MRVLFFLLPLLLLSFFRSGGLDALCLAFSSIFLSSIEPASFCDTHNQHTKADYKPVLLEEKEDPHPGPLPRVGEGGRVFKLFLFCATAVVHTLQGDRNGSRALVVRVFGSVIAVLGGFLWRHGVRCLQRRFVLGVGQRRQRGGIRGRSRGVCAKLGP